MKCDKPSAFKDFVDILQENYEHLAQELNTTVTKVRRQKRCLKKNQPEVPKRRPATSGDSLDDVFVEIATSDKDSKTLPNYTPMSLCHRCRRRIKSEISAEAGRPNLCFSGRYGWNEQLSRLDSLSSDPQLSDSSSDNEKTVLVSQGCVQNGILSEMPTDVKMPFDSYKTWKGVDTTETLVKERVSTTIFTSPRQGEENTDMHGLSVNYGNTDRLNKENTMQNNCHADVFSCQCANIFSVSEFKPIIEQDIKLVAYSSSEIGEDMPDTCRIDTDNEDTLTASNMVKKCFNGQDSDPEKLAGVNTTEDLPLSYNNSTVDIVKPVTDTPDCSSGETDALNDNPCKHSNAVRRTVSQSNRCIFKERNAVLFNVSLDEPNNNPTAKTPVKESHIRHATLSRTNFDESFGFKYVSGEKRPRFKDDVDYYISDIIPNSLASACSDLRQMYTILSVNGQPLCDKSLDDISRLFQSSLTVTLALKPEGNNQRNVPSFLA